jgi:hypothetical protein
MHRRIGAGGEIFDVPTFGVGLAVIGVRMMS